MTSVGMNYDRTENSHLMVPFLLEKAFRSLEDVRFIEPDSKEVPDLMVNSMPWNRIKRGVRTVYWELDIAEHNHSDDYRQFDTVYFPSNMYKEIWPEHGKFLPMAVDMEFFHPVDVAKTKDVVFMGRLDRSLRSKYLEKLGEKFEIEVGARLRGIKTCEALCAGKCSFQISEFKNLEQRNFEYSAVLPMVLERVPDLDVFEEDVHYKGFDRDNYPELEEKIAWCVNNPKASTAMRDRMIQHLVENHTYQHRARQLLDEIKV